MSVDFGLNSDPYKITVPDASKEIAKGSEECSTQSKSVAETILSKKNLTKPAVSALRVAVKELVSAVTKNPLVNSVAMGVFNSNLEGISGYKTQAQQNEELLKVQSDLIEEYLLKEIENYEKDSQKVQNKIDLAFQEIVDLYKETKNPEVVDSFVMGTLGSSLLFSLIHGTPLKKKTNPITDVEKTSKVFNTHFQENIETTTGILKELGEKLLAAQNLPNTHGNAANLEKRQAVLTLLKPIVDVGLLGIFSRAMVAMAPAFSASPAGAIIGPALLVGILSNSLYRSAGVKEHIYKIEGNEVVVDTKREVGNETMKAAVGSGVGNVLKSQSKGIQMTGKVMADLLGDFLFPKNMNAEEKKKLAEDSVGILFNLLHGKTNEMQIENLKVLIQSNREIYSRMIENEKDPEIRKNLQSIVNESIHSMESELSELINSTPRDSFTEDQVVLFDLEVNTVRGAIAYNLAQYRSEIQVEDKPQDIPATPRDGKPTASEDAPLANEPESMGEGLESMRSIEKLVPEMINSLKIRSFSEELRSITGEKKSLSQEFNAQFFEDIYFIDQQMEQIKDLCTKYSAVCDSEQMNDLRKIANTEIEKLKQASENLIDLFSNFRTIPISENGLSGDLVSYKIECDKIRLIKNINENYQISDSETKSRISGLVEKLEQRANNLKEDAEALLRKDLASRVSEFSKKSSGSLERIEGMFEIFKGLNEFKAFLDEDDFEFTDCLGDCDLKDLALIENDLEMFVAGLSSSVLSVATSGHISNEGLKTLSVIAKELKSLNNNIQNYGGLFSNKSELISLLKKTNKQVRDAGAVYQEERVGKLKKMETKKRESGVKKPYDLPSNKGSELLHQKLESQNVQRRNALRLGAQKKVSIPRVPRLKK